MNIIAVNDRLAYNANTQIAKLSILYIISRLNLLTMLIKADARKRISLLKTKSKPTLRYIII